MTYHCPKCGEGFKTQDQTEPLPATCPECGADLYPEEILYQQMISDSNVDAVLV
ncbi:MAG: zinc ribbon domain-containing protein [Planctomycetota bacterium]|jgi:predicted  nucleic acid-binding Zn-ribbon protein